MQFLFNNADGILWANIIAALAVFLFLVALHAYQDANKWRKKAEELYNSQPRIKPLQAKLKWPARFISLITLKK